MRAIGSVHDYAPVGEEDRRASRGGDCDCETAGTAALQHRVMAASEETFPRKGKTVGAEAREVWQVRPARTGGDPVGGRDFGDNNRDLTHRRSSVCSRKSPGPLESDPRAPP